MYDPNAVKIYTDGSAMPNPGNGGVGIVVVFPDDAEAADIEISEGYKLSTNNRMELKAVIRAFEWLQQNSGTYRFTRAIIITDSDYVHSNCGNVQYWKKDGWVNKDGKPYENTDLWNDFLRVQAKLKLRVDITWTKGKESDVLNRVDKLAKQGAKNPTLTDSGYNGGKFTAPRTPTKKAATLYPGGDEQVLIRIYRSSIYGRNEKQVYRLAFDLYDEESQSYVSKHMGYSKTDFNLKRNTCFRVRFDGNQCYPLIVEAEEIEYLKGT